LGGLVVGCVCCFFGFILYLIFDIKKLFYGVVFLQSTRKTMAPKVINSAQKWIIFLLRILTMGQIMSPSIFYGGVNFI
jgi:hypothetical protein